MHPQRAFAREEQPAAENHDEETTWWHVLAIDGSHWSKPTRGIHKINALSSTALPQIAVPGWTLIESARRGHWDDLCEQLTLVARGRTSELHLHTGQPSIPPYRLATLASASGETLLGLLCTHDERAGEDPAHGDETGQTPAEKQFTALTLLLKYTVELEKRARSPCAQDMGIPAEDAWMREASQLGAQNSLFFSLCTRATVDVAVHVLNIVAAICKRATSVSELRVFFQTHGEEMLLQCVANRHHTCVVPVLQALLGIEAVWERRSKRLLRTNDSVQVWFVSVCLSVMHFSDVEVFFFVTQSQALACVYVCVCSHIVHVRIHAHTNLPKSHTHTRIG
jgi:hypothetical protein